MSWPWIGATVFWLAGVGGVCVWVIEHSLQTYSSDVVQDSTTWPTATSLNLSSKSPTLVLFLHPKCPCSWASVRELDRVLDVALATHSLPKTLIIASVPADIDSGWLDSDLIQRARQLPNSSFMADVGGVESSRFAVNTSGTVMLFNPTGQRMFSGGITISRGHEGDSLGGRLLIDLLTSTKTNTQEINTSRIATTPPVFGCKLCLSALLQDAVPSIDEAAQ